MKTNSWVSLLFLWQLSVPDLSQVILAMTRFDGGRASAAGKWLAFRFKESL